MKRRVRVSGVEDARNDGMSRAHVTAMNSPSGAAKSSPTSHNHNTLFRANTPGREQSRCNELDSFYDLWQSDVDGTSGR